MTFTPEFTACVSQWRNEDDYNVAFHASLSKLTDSVPMLKAHRDWVEANQFGFGDRPFHYLWKMLVEQMPQEFAFLEIGVFKGQILSLVELLAKDQGKRAFIYGISPLDNTRDVRCDYPKDDYPKRIREIYQHFGLTMDRTQFIVGRSADPCVVSQAQAIKHIPFDLVYIDGSHDYAEVLHDIQAYAPMVKLDGFLVMDDASIGRLNVGSCWPGLEDVAQAVKDALDKDERFKFLLACGHINVFQRIEV